MTDFFAENTLFVVNAALLAGLIAGAYALQNSGNTAAAPVVTQAAAVTPAPADVVPSAAVPGQVKPRVHTSNEEDD